MCMCERERERERPPLNRAINRATIHINRALNDVIENFLIYKWSIKTYIKIYK